MIEYIPFFVIVIAIAGLSFRDLKAAKENRRIQELIANEKSNIRFSRSRPKTINFETDFNSAKEIESKYHKHPNIAFAHDLMSMLISLVILAAALFIILSTETYSDGQQKWAFAAVGTITGFWLKR